MVFKISFYKYLIIEEYHLFSVYEVIIRHAAPAAFE